MAYAGFVPRNLSVTVSLSNGNSNAFDSSKPFSAKQSKDFVVAELEPANTALVKLDMCTVRKDFLEERTHLNLQHRIIPSRIMMTTRNRDNITASTTVPGKGLT